MIDLKTLTIKKAHDALVKGEYSAVDLANSYLEQIKKIDKDVHAYLEVFFDDALKQAKESDERRKKGLVCSKIDGCPIAVKDNMAMEETKTTSASKILENFLELSP